MKLLEVAKKVIAVELDPRMVLELQRRVQNTPYVNHLQVCISCVSQSERLFFSFGNRITIVFIGHPYDVWDAVPLR
jgi:16S rRNA A1518/A1519 N6-dimethyltransferase RsmA/KsgA/DIM1 with predicted DNA glycosylase/AP lyase activity